MPLYILDPLDAAMGAAPQFRLGLGLEKFDKALRGCGSQLNIRRGDALAVLKEICTEVGAQAVVWSRAYDPEAIARDTGVKSALKDVGIPAKSTGGRVLFEPWTVATGAGGMFKVYTPFWKAVRDREPDGLTAGPEDIPAPPIWPASVDLSDLGLGGTMNRGAEIVAAHCHVGEEVAQARLDQFLERRVLSYQSDRDVLGVQGCSGLSENLAWGEISPHRIWHAAMAVWRTGVAQSGTETFLKELCWREFAYHLMYHSPEILTRNWRSQWDGFPWEAKENAATLAWQQGRTGHSLIDAAMRELYVTGHMHNRARMVVASFLCKNLMVHWKIGMRWFEECLVDWDPAANAMGWQWVAGSGPDAAPFFRIFNPDTQAQTHDSQRSYRDRWLAEGRRAPTPEACAFFDAVPRSWTLAPNMEPALPVVDLKAGRARALEAYAALKSQSVG
jgi:deoxyribodipyrimidine photo-lyase